MVGGGHGGRGGAAGGREEADRWLVTSEKLLASNDLQGAKTFAIRACEADPTRAQAADYILAICDVLIAGESRLGGESNLSDWYAVLRLGRLAQNPEHVATQYRRLALLLNPSVNKLPFADRAFKLVSDAWHVLSDPSRKSSYDRELQPSQLGQSGSQPQIQPRQQQQLNPRKCTNVAQPPSSVARSVTSTAVNPPRPSVSQPFPSTSVNPPPPSVPRQATPTGSVYPPPFQSQSKTPTDPTATSFWTACPYCFVLFEYAKAYEECTLKCQNCRRAFQAVTIQKPPVEGKGEDVYFCSWAVFPLGFSGEFKKPTWSPISPLFACPIQKVDDEPTTKKRKEQAPPRIYYDDDEVYVAISDEDYEENDGIDDDDEDWQEEVQVSKKGNVGKGKETVVRSNKKHGNERGKRGMPNVESINFARNPAYSDAKAVGSSSGVMSKSANYATRKRTGTGGKNLGRLDLNVEFSNEVEEQPGRNEGNGMGSNREVDNIEGIGFFEGLDEFLSSLPILSVVGDDKIKAT